MKYELIIKDLETEEIVFDEKCDAALGGIAYRKGESTDEVSGRSFAAIHAETAVCLGVCEVTEEAIEALRKKIADEFILGLAETIKEKKE